MAIPDYQALMLPLLRIARDQETRVPDAARQIAGLLGLTNEECEEMLHRGRQRVLHNRIHWAKFYMGKAGLIDSPGRGRFTASAAGRILLDQQPATLDLNRLKTYPAFKEFYERSGEATGDEEPATRATVASEATPEEQIDAAHTTIQRALKADLLQRILGQSSAFFERLIVEFLVAMGYGGTHDRAAHSLLYKGGDGGIDGIVDEDRLGLDSIYVQAKRYARHLSVGRPEIQGFCRQLGWAGRHQRRLRHYVELQQPGQRVRQAHPATGNLDRWRTPGRPAGRA